MISITVSALLDFFFNNNNKKKQNLAFITLFSLWFITLLVICSYTLLPLLFFFFWRIRIQKAEHISLFLEKNQRGDTKTVSLYFSSFLLNKKNEKHSAFIFYFHFFSFYICLYIYIYRLLLREKSEHKRDMGLA